MFGDKHSYASVRVNDSLTGLRIRNEVVLDKLDFTGLTPKKADVIRKLLRKRLDRKMTHIRKEVNDALDTLGEIQALTIYLENT